MSASVKESEQTSNAALDDRSLRLAIAISLLRSKALQKQSIASSHPSESDAIRWKRKAKERKQELRRLREDLREAEGALDKDLFSQSASCKCYFFDNLGKLSPKQLGDATDHRLSDVLRRRFLRQVRFKDRRRGKSSSIGKEHFSDLSWGDATDHLKAAVDFLVELCNNASPVDDATFANLAHQAVDFILASLKNLLLTGKRMGDTEGIVNCLITCLIKRMCPPLRIDELQYNEADAQCYVQHLIRKLAIEPYIGQRAIIAVSQKLCVGAETLLFLDPFDESFLTIHGCVFIMIQLIEFLVSDYIQLWSRDESFDNALFEEWLISILQAKTALRLLESRNVLYLLFMDRVTGELAKQLGQISTFQVRADILDELLR